MGAEGAGRGELAELVADHRLGDEDGHVLAAVVDGDRVADHLREDGRAARPGLDHLLGARGVHRLDARQQALLHVRALLRRASHGLTSLLLAAPATADDHRARLLVLLAGPVAERRLAPRGLRVAAGALVGLAAAVRVVDRVHRDAAALRALALVAAAAGLADGDVLMLGVGEGPDRRPALGADHPHLRGGQPQRDHAAVLRDHLDRGAGGAAHAAALAGLELDVVDDGAGRDRAELERVAGADVGAGAGGDRVADLACPAGRGCRTWRRRRSAAARCRWCGSGRTRSSRPWPARRPWSA